MEDREYVLVQRRALALTGIDLRSYKSKQMRRRLGSLLRQSGYRSWFEYLRVMEKDEDVLQQFKDFITINVSSFFRDPEKFKQLRANILPALLRDRRFLSVWSAGSSHGGEPYTIAMLLQEDAPGRPHRILGTDIDRRNLEKSQAGGPYSHDDVKTVHPALLKKYFTREGSEYRVADSIRRMVRFRYFNLLEDTVTGRFDLIVCRNVVIYFTERNEGPAVSSILRCADTGWGAVCRRHRNRNQGAGDRVFWRRDFVLSQEWYPLNITG